jgi:hypothetical protein
MASVFDNGVWRKAIRKAISTICGVLILNMTDPQAQLYTWQWWKHCFLGVVILTVITEAQYWKQWADSANGTLERDIQYQANAAVEAARKGVVDDVSVKKGASS